MITVDQMEIRRREYFLTRKLMGDCQQVGPWLGGDLRGLFCSRNPGLQAERPCPQETIGPLLEVIQQWLQEDKQRPAEQWYTAKRI